MVYTSSLNLLLLNYTAVLITPINPSGSCAFTRGHNGWIIYGNDIEAPSRGALASHGGGGHAVSGARGPESKCILSSYSQPCSLPGHPLSIQYGWFRTVWLPLSPEARPGLELPGCTSVDARTRFIGSSSFTQEVSRPLNRRSDGFSERIKFSIGVMKRCWISKILRPDALC